MSPNQEPGDPRLKPLFEELAGEDLHLTEEELGRLALGKASPAEVESAELHLELCAACRKDLEDLRAIPPAPVLQNSLSVIPTEPESADTKKRPPIFLWLLSGGSTLAAACLLTYVAISRPWEERAPRLVPGEIPPEKLAQLEKREHDLNEGEAAVKSGQSKLNEDKIAQNKHFAERERDLDKLKNDLSNQKPRIEVRQAPPRIIVRREQASDQAPRLLDDGNPAGGELFGSPNQCTIYYDKQVKLFWQTEDGSLVRSTARTVVKVWKVDDKQKLTFYHQYPAESKFRFRIVDLEYGPNGKDQIYQWELYAVSSPDPGELDPTKAGGTPTTKDEEVLIGRPFRFVLRKGLNR